MQACEQHVLSALGWQQAYSPNGYSIDAELPGNDSLDAWESFGWPHLSGESDSERHSAKPAQWLGGQGNFPALQSMNFSFASLNGSLLASWGQPWAFPELLNINMSLIELSGKLPAAWGSPQAFQKLEELHLATTNIAGDLHAMLAAL